ncbi:MAG: hypothetical protein WC882_01115 [Candidatus Gracilibacteria bacterium]
MNSKIKLALPLVLLSLMSLSGCGADENIPKEECIPNPNALIDPCADYSNILESTGKPVIYLYPEQETKVSVQVAYQGLLTSTYPQAQNGAWEVIASPDGTLSDGNRTYDYLFWEGISPLTETFQFTDGFVVQREEIIPFLEEKLTVLGLNDSEQDDFISYWLPQMNGKGWVMVRFLKDEYEAMVKTTIVPQPDTVIRVFMIVKEIDSPVDLPMQELTPAPERSGFTVVEWGGSDLGE